MNDVQKQHLDLTTRLKEYARQCSTAANYEVKSIDKQVNDYLLTHFKADQTYFMKGWTEYYQHMTSEYMREKRIRK